MDENSLSAMLTMLNTMSTRIEVGSNPWFGNLFGSVMCYVI